MWHVHAIDHGLKHCAVVTICKAKVKRCENKIPVYPEAAQQQPGKATQGAQKNTVQSGSSKAAVCHCGTCRDGLRGGVGGGGAAHRL